MSRKAIEQIIERWQNDPTFRDELRTDPEGTVRRSGLELSEEEWATLRSLDWNQIDDDLNLGGHQGVVGPGTVL